MERSETCCFTGHRPHKLPWGNDERDPRCLTLKRSISREVEALYRQGYRHFISGMALGCDLYFAEAVLELKAIYPDATLEAALPCPEQTARWSEHDRSRWQSILDRCDVESVVQDHYDRWCMLRRDRYMVERSAVILAVFDDSPGGTKYTLDHAAAKGLSILLLDLNHPEAPATRLLREPDLENFSFPI
ncbi:MAG: SLOG family protein [Oscillospiraceae bacterium]|nr:SLOG family protein [Oscillospiraceae bacterium]